MARSDLDSAELLSRYRLGDPEAADELYYRYSDRLLTLVRSRLSRRLSRRIDAEDVLQSAYRSFFIRAKNGQYALARPGDLWRLLTAITLHKVGRQAAHHTALKRSVRREDPQTDTANGGAPPASAREPSSAEVVAAAEEIHWLMARLGPRQRQALELQVAGKSVAEIAEATGRTERTVRRWIGDACAMLESRWARSSGGTAAGRADDALADSWPGEPLRYENYLLERLIAFGGMCKVYEATHKPSGTRVCVKVLRKRAAANRAIVSRFVAEARIVAKLAHPQVVSIHGLGRFPGGGLFMAMDLVDGADLWRTCGNDGFPLLRAVEIVEEVARVVEHAHQLGIVHCDLKPHNVLVDRQGQVFVTDFGFAYELTASDGNGGHPTGGGGTAAFMAPEQLDASCGKIGPHTDVYGLGSLLYAILTGGPPGEGILAAEVFASIVAAQPAGGTGEVDNAGLNTLTAICARCLERSPVSRYASAAEVAAALARWASEFRPAVSLG